MTATILGKCYVGFFVLLLLVACSTTQNDPIDCGESIDCYAEALAKCSPATTIIEDEDGQIWDSEIRGVIGNNCNELLTAKAPDAIAGLDAVCEVPLEFQGTLGTTDICKYCEGSLIDEICE